MSVVGQVARQVVVAVGKDVIVSVATAAAEVVVKRLADGAKGSANSEAESGSAVA